MSGRKLNNNREKRYFLPDCYAFSQDPYKNLFLGMIYHAATNLDDGRIRDECIYFLQFTEMGRYILDQKGVTLLERERIYKKFEKGTAKDGKEGESEIEGTRKAGNDKRE